MSNEITQQTPQAPQTRTPVAIGARGIALTSYDELVRFSLAVVKSGLAPKGIQTQEAVFVVIQMGLEVGLTPMAALQNISAINGRPSIWGDAQLGIVRATGELEEFTEWYEQAGKRLPRNPVTFTDDTVAVCRVKRKGYEASEVGFSVADAKKAELWSKTGPWAQYPARMLRNRARSFCLRDNFGDALKGLRTQEEAQDMPPEIVVSGGKTADEILGRAGSSVGPGSASALTVSGNTPISLPPGGVVSATVGQTVSPAVTNNPWALPVSLPQPSTDELPMEASK